VSEVDFEERVMGRIVHRRFGIDWPPAALIALFLITSLLPLPSWRAIVQLVLVAGILGWFVWRFVRRSADRDTVE
jgi:hypothetical protein